MPSHIARSHRHLSARQNLRKLRCRTHLLQWEPFPKPFVPKNPLKFIDIGPFFALREKIMMIPPLTKAINRRNEGIRGGCNFGKREEREREDLKRRKHRGREGSALNWVPKPRTTQGRIPRPTTQINCEPKTAVWSSKPVLGAYTSKRMRAHKG